jgi:hypothetical protein
MRCDRGTKRVNSTHGIGIVVLLKRRLPRKIANKSPIVGAATALADKKPGRVFASGPGTCAWSWDINGNLNRSVRLSLLPLFRQ